MNRLWDELACMKKNAPNYQEDEEEKLMQFLMGLNPEYEAVKDQILLMDPLPVVSKAYSMVANIEKQKAMNDDDSHGLKNSVMMTKKVFKPDAKRKDWEQLKIDKSHWKCDFCGGKGHLKEGCFKIKGYPDW